jgi:hypothetical protein
MPIYKYFDAVTNTISYNDTIRLRSETFPIRVVPHEYGWWINVPTDKDDFDDAVKKLTEAGMTKAFIKLISTARDAGCYWINLDRDGDPHPGLRTFNW